MIDDRLAAAIRAAFDSKYQSSPGLENRVVSAIPWRRPPEPASSVPRLAGAFTAILTLLIVAVMAAPSVLTLGSHRIPSSPPLVNTDPRCKGIRLLPDRTFQRIAVYRWRNSGSTFVAEPAGINGSMVTDASFLDATQPDDRSVVVYFNAHGQAVLDQLTAEIAIPQTTGVISDTPEHHLPVLIGLTDEQVATWANSAVARKALMPVEQGGNLLSNGLVIQPFTGNQLLVYFGSDLSTACSLTARSG
jgi:hypothetical protein